MACKNAFLTRFAVKITDSPYAVIPCKKFITVSELSTGTEGSITLRECDKTVEIPDNVRAIPPLEMDLLISSKDAIDTDVKFFMEWYDERKTKVRDIKIYLTDRRWSPLLIYDCVGVSFTNYHFPPPAMGEAKLLTMHLSFKPYNIRIRRPDVSLRGFISNNLFADSTRK